MTDKEIIKALECCGFEYGNLCSVCPKYEKDNDFCQEELHNYAIDLINRQKAEIEKLKIENQSLRAAANSYKIHYDEARAEAVKEFAYRLKDYAEECKRNGYDGIGGHDIDDILKEMAGDTE